MNPGQRKCPKLATTESARNCFTSSIKMTTVQHLRMVPGRAGADCRCAGAVASAAGGARAGLGGRSRETQQRRRRRRRCDSRGEMAPNSDQGAGVQTTATAAATEVRGPRKDGAERRSRRGGATTATAAAKKVRRPRRDGAERRSRRVGRNNSDGGGDRGAAAEERWLQAAIKARG
jgi:hypothetical protein